MKAFIQNYLIWSSVKFLGKVGPFKVKTLYSCNFLACHSTREKGGRISHFYSSTSPTANLKPICNDLHFTHPARQELMFSYGLQHFNKVIYSVFHRRKKKQTQKELSLTSHHLDLLFSSTSLIPSGPRALKSSVHRKSLLTLPNSTTLHMAPAVHWQGRHMFLPL